MKEIKMSGVIDNIDESFKDNRRILLDCGGIATVRDFVLNNCGGYRKGNRITITITPCEKDEFYYPSKPTLTKM